MRYIALLAFLSQPLRILADPTHRPTFPPGQSRKGMSVGAASSSATTTITASVVPPASQASSLQPVVTTTKTIDVSAFITSTFSTSQPTTTLNTYTSSSSLTLSAMPRSSTAGATNDDSSRHRTLVIIISTVLGFVGLLLILGLFFLIYRYRRGQAPFGHRGASPINDDEIASWRQNALDQKRQLQKAHLPPAKPEIAPLTLGAPPNWTWAASPTSIHSLPSPSPRYHPDSPTFLAKAPNSRAGLTDEAIPGADPFIATVKRQSSRLSKAPPGHVRTKSMRSSVSGRSVGSLVWQKGRASSDSKSPPSNFSWFDPEDESVVGQLRTERTSSSFGNSVFDGLAVGGLSPRPQPKQDGAGGGDTSIGRAIG